MAELKARLPAGMMTNQIVAAFGSTDHAEGSGDGRDVWRYNLPPFPTEDWRYQVYEVTMIITNGHLDRWDCSFASLPGTRTAYEEIYPATGNTAPLVTQQEGGLLKFYIVSTNPVTGGRFIDTELFPKLGYISLKANLEISDLKGVTFEERS